MLDDIAEVLLDLLGEVAEAGIEAAGKKKKRTGSRPQPIKADRLHTAKKKEEDPWARKQETPPWEG